MTAAENAPLELLYITIKHPGKECLTASHVQKVILCLNFHSYRIMEHNIKFSFLLISRDPMTRPAINCLQIIVCSCATSSNFLCLQIIFSLWIALARVIVMCMSILYLAVIDLFTDTAAILN